MLCLMVGRSGGKKDEWMKAKGQELLSNLRLESRQSGGRWYQVYVDVAFVWICQQAAPGGFWIYLFLGFCAAGSSSLSDGERGSPPFQESILKTRSKKLLLNAVIYNCTGLPHSHVLIHTDSETLLLSKESDLDYCLAQLVLTGWHVHIHGVARCLLILCFWPWLNLKRTSLSSSLCNAPFLC